MEVDKENQLDPENENVPPEEPLQPRPRAVRRRGSQRRPNPSRSNGSSSLAVRRSDRARPVLRPMEIDDEVLGEIERVSPGSLSHEEVVEDDDEDDGGDSDYRQRTRRRRKTPGGTTTRRKVNGQQQSARPASPEPMSPNKCKRLKIETEEETYDAPPSTFQPSIVADLAENYPDKFCKYRYATPSENDELGPGMISLVNENYRLELLKDVDIRDQGQITGMVLDDDGEMLATFCNTGTTKVWDMDDFQMIQLLRDEEEDNIDEHYVGRFHPSEPYLVIGGKLKNRKRWSKKDDDNEIMPCPLKVFDLTTGKVVARFEGHSEEILCVKHVKFRAEDYLLTTSQDGYIIKWQVSKDWCSLTDKWKMTHDRICMAFTASFLPNTGNKYFACACEDGVAIFDFELCQYITMFHDLYYYCDCAKFVNPVDLPCSPSWQDVISASFPAKEDSRGKNNSGRTLVVVPESDEPVRRFAYLLARGVEVLDAEDNTVNSKPNTVNLYKLNYPTTDGGQFSLELFKQYSDEKYLSNSWLVKISSNGRYVAAPTFDGQVFLFELATGQVVEVLKDHEACEVRDVIFHPSRPMLFTTGDDGAVKVYRTKDVRYDLVNEEGAVDVEP
ncbi:WD40-repeat-containing domain protein [Cladochytrium replicatum]|nr:WD40-repeat-containing domain protein [Cladochytrium replicatum]